MAKQLISGKKSQILINALKMKLFYKVLQGKSFKYTFLIRNRLKIDFFQNN